MKEKTVKLLEQAEERFVIDAVTAADDATFKEKMALANRCSIVTTKERDKKLSKKEETEKKKLEERKLSISEEQIRLEEGKLNLEKKKLEDSNIQEKLNRRNTIIRVSIEAVGKTIGVVVGAVLSYRMGKKYLIAEYKDNIIVPTAAKEQKKFIQNLK